MSVTEDLIENYIQMPIDTTKVDLRNVIPLSKCKVRAVSGMNATEIYTASDIASKEEDMANQRQVAKQKQAEDFLKKTKDRVRQQKAAQQSEKIQIEKPSITAPVNKSGEIFEEQQKPKERLSYFTKKPAYSHKRTAEKETISTEIQSKSRKPEETKIKSSSQKKSKVNGIPRFVSVEDMKVQFNPKIFNPSKSMKKAGTASNEFKKSLSSQGIESSKELEQSRYSTALKTLVRDQMQAKLPSNVPVVCTCGAAGSSSKSNTKCANNCPFYKKQQDYQKALNEMLTSFKASE